MSLPFCVHASPRSDLRLRALPYAGQETGHREPSIIDGSPGQNNAKQGAVQIDAFMIRCKLAILVVIALCSSNSAQCQNGDNAGEVQTTLVPKEKIPAAPPLTPQKSLETFKVAPGYRVELVASEPMVEVPIIAQFDPDGRLWVVEMRSFMPTPDGQGEDQPASRISILEDTNGDGRMDKKAVFLDGLVLPRALLLVNNGILVCEPPKLWFYPT